MIPALARLSLVALLAVPAAAAGQTAPATPAIKPAPRATVHATPLVAPKPGVPGHSPANAPGHSPAHAPGHAPAHAATRPRPPAPNAAAKPAAPAPAPVAAAPEPEKPAEPTKGSNTGQPIPRFATLRSDEVNLRTGPGTRYPIEWVYKRRDLPVEIEREFEVWRLVQDQEGVKGWVHQAVLAPRRTGVVVGGEHVLRATAADDGTPVARLKPGVILRLRSCEAASDWCQASVQDYRGFIKRVDIWGVMPGEAIQ